MTLVRTGRKPAPVSLSVQQGDITSLRGGSRPRAIVNAANSSLMGGGGVDGAIHLAGGPAILRECKALRVSVLGSGGLLTGQAVATTAGDLAAEYVIHTVAPRYTQPDLRVSQGNPERLLMEAYRSALRVADALECKMVMVPLLGAGIYGWPLDRAVSIAVGAIRSARVDHVDSVCLVAFTPEIEQAIRVKILSGDVCGKCGWELKGRGWGGCMDDYGPVCIKCLHPQDG